jgi:protease II
LLFVYGAYGHNLEANFKLHRLCLLNRGWVLGFVHARCLLAELFSPFVAAHLNLLRYAGRFRGGGELGKRWYEDGKLLHKMNTFHDFVAAAQWVISERYSSPKFMAAKGQSAGALALGTWSLLCDAVARGAVLSQDSFPGTFCRLRDQQSPRPLQGYDYEGVVTENVDVTHGFLYSECVRAQVPFLDVLGAMSDPNLPLTIQEYPEWGNPNIPEQRAVIQSYCPTTNIPVGVVPPAILLSSGWPVCLVALDGTSMFQVTVCAASTSDPRVPLWQCVKYLSRLRQRAQEKPAAEPKETGIWETFSKNIDYVLGKQGHRMIVADIDEHAGHFGAAGHSAQTAAYSLEVAFLHKALGLKLK